MIGFLRGRIAGRDEDSLTIDVGGVGYELQCSSGTLLDTLELEAAGGEAQLWVHTHLREDALVLFGFATPMEKRIFLSLLKVNGVGPKMAIKILSGATPSQLAEMIESGDVRGLSNLPKVGKKTAEQLILSLKGKLVIEAETATKRSSKTAPAGATASRLSGSRGEILSALVNLGFRIQDAERVVTDFPEDIDLQQGVRKGLQALAGSV
jgi:Holliday junction DNA helicase RuvA